MRKLLIALFCSLFFTPVFADLATDKKIYHDTIIWPILKKVIPCQPNYSGLPSNPTQAQLDACWALWGSTAGVRYPTLDAFKQEADTSTTMHAKLARGAWKIVTATTPAEFPIWDQRCGVIKKKVVDAVTGVVTWVPVTTFEECAAVVNLWTNAESKAAFLSRSYVADENGNWVDHRRAYTIQPKWAKLLGHTNPRFAADMWAARLSTLNAKLAAAATTP